MKRKGFPSLFPNHVSYFTPTLRFGVEEVEKRCQGRGKGEEREETREWGRGEGIDVHAGRAQDGPLPPWPTGSLEQVPPTQVSISPPAWDTLSANTTFGFSS